MLGGKFDLVATATVYKIPHPGSPRVRGLVGRAKTRLVPWLWVHAGGRGRGLVLRLLDTYKRMHSAIHAGHNSICRAIALRAIHFVLFTRH